MQKAEKVLVIKRDLIFKRGFWEGIQKENLGYYLNLIKNHSQFKPREKVENDFSFKQIVPYIIFSFQDKYFIFQHLKGATEQRLKGDWLLGVSGHINPIDIKSNQNILEIAAQREWDEEIKYKGKIKDLAKFVKNTGGYAPIVYRDYIKKLKKL